MEPAGEPPGGKPAGEPAGGEPHPPGLGERDEGG